MREYDFTLSSHFSSSGGSKSHRRARLIFSPFDTVLDPIRFKRGLEIGDETRMSIIRIRIDDGKIEDTDDKAYRRDARANGGKAKSKETRKITKLEKHPNSLQPRSIDPLTRLFIRYSQ